MKEQERRNDFVNVEHKQIPILKFDGCNVEVVKGCVSNEVEAEMETEGRGSILLQLRELIVIAILGY